MKESKKWIICFSVLSLIAMLIIALTNIIVDPYFHYHKPLKSLYYYLNNQRYQNDGILKHFDYDALIIGTSMAENFKTSEFDRLFGSKSVKTCFSGAYYKEIDQNINTALKHNKNLKIVLRCLDGNRIADEKDTKKDETPDYLYDNNPFNDIKYFLNKDIFTKSFNMIKNSFKDDGGGTDFDSYSSWHYAYVFDKEVVLESYSRKPKVDTVNNLTESERNIIIENIKQNVTDTIERNPDVRFYLFFSPYSIIYWDDLNQKNMIYKQIETEKIAIEMLLEYENVSLFSFNTEESIVCDLNNYKDPGHYSADINSSILQNIKAENNLLTKENYLSYLNYESSFFSNYDYEAIFSNDN